MRLYRTTTISFNTRCELYDEPFIQILKALEEDEDLIVKLGVEFVLVAGRDNVDFAIEKLKGLDKLEYLHYDDPINTLEGFSQCGFNMGPHHVVRFTTKSDLFEEDFSDILKELSNGISGKIDCRFEVDVDRFKAAFVIEVIDSLVKGKYLEPKYRNPLAEQILRDTKVKLY